MKVAFGEPLNRADTGKHKFLSRLAAQMQRTGVKVVCQKKSDIFLHIGRNTDWAVSPKRVVMRVDGLILNQEKPFESMNNRMIKRMNRSNGLIYQSTFCKDAHVRFLNVNKNHRVILNGADPSEFLSRNPKNFFFASCCWRPHKRLKDICKGFVRAVSRGLDADLIVAGKTDPPVSHPRIKYVGWVKPKQLKVYLSEAIASIHLAWLDWCPNSMVEAAVAGCPLIYSDSGGSSEVGKNCGISIADVPWDYKPCRLYRPPKLNYDSIANAMFSLKENQMELDNERLFIDNIAKQYVDFFEDLLK